MSQDHQKNIIPKITVPKTIAAKMLTPKALTREGFSAYGDVIEVNENAKKIENSLTRPLLIQDQSTWRLWCERMEMRYE